jgi:hypothetical protein
MVLERAVSPFPIVVSTVASATGDQRDARTSSDSKCLPIYFETLIGESSAALCVTKRFEPLTSQKGYELP